MVRWIPSDGDVCAVRQQTIHSKCVKCIGRCVCVCLYVREGGGGGDPRVVSRAQADRVCASSLSSSGSSSSVATCVITTRRRHHSRAQHKTQQTFCTLCSADTHITQAYVICTYSHILYIPSLGLQQTPNTQHHIGVIVIAITHRTVGDDHQRDGAHYQLGICVRAWNVCCPPLVCLVYCVMMIV